MAKILILSQYWVPENGVPQRRWDWLAKILTESGHEVRVLTPPPHYRRRVTVTEWLRGPGFHLRASDYEMTGGFRVYRTGFVPSGRSLSARIANQAWIALSMGYTLLFPPKTLSSYKPDLVIGTVPALPTAVVAFLAGKRFRTPFVIDLRDAWPALFKESSEWNRSVGPSSWREKVLKRGPLQILIFLTEKVLNFVLRKSDGIITTSSNLCEELKREYRDKPITTVRNVFPNTGYGWVRLNAKNPGHLNVLYAGTLGRAQQLENALIAARQCQDQGIHLSLRFVGDGAAWYRLKELNELYGVNAEFYHQVAPEELGEHYQWADTALVHLADWKSLESAVPSKTYELMENQIFISASVGGETAELVEQTNAGEIITPNRPDELAAAWVRASSGSHRRVGDPSAKRWVDDQRHRVAPNSLLGLINEILNGSLGK